MRTRLAASALALALLLGQPGGAAERGPFERYGDFGALGLPAAAGLCALVQGRFASFLAGLGAQAATVEALKKSAGNGPINRRPHGGRNGIVSGHMAAATFGATSLARRCFPDQPILGGFAYGLALTVGASRMDANKHSGLQIIGGAIIGYAANGVGFVAGPRGFALTFTLDF